MRTQSGTVTVLSSFLLNRFAEIYFDRDEGANIRKYQKLNILGGGTGSPGTRSAPLCPYLRKLFVNSHKWEYNVLPHS